SRTAAEGLVAFKAGDKAAVLVEINSETDFVARNEEFQNFVRNVADVALTKADTVEQLADAPMNGKKVSENLTDLIAKIGENMTIRRMAKLSVADGAVIGYVHNSVAP